MSLIKTREPLPEMLHHLILNGAQLIGLRLFLSMKHFSFLKVNTNQSIFDYFNRDTGRCVSVGVTPLEGAG